MHMNVYPILIRGLSMTSMVVRVSKIMSKVVDSTRIWMIYLNNSSMVVVVAFTIVENSADKNTNASSKNQT